MTVLEAADELGEVSTSNCNLEECIPELLNTNIRILLYRLAQEFK